MTDGTPSRAQIIVHVFGRTDVGRTREHNEDAFVVADLTTDQATLLPDVRTHTLGDLGSLFMVADGMGGAAAGELASQMATEVVLGEMRRNWRSTDKKELEPFASCLKAAAESANAHIHEYATKHPENRGMGSTATIAGLLSDSLCIAQIGDSRGYLVRNGTAQQITKDQSLVQRLVEAGEITPEEAELSDRKNIILQALGPEANVKIDLTQQQVRRGDVLILCSDGLSGQVRGDEIGQVVREQPDLMGVCRRLIEMANEAGGPDNITVIAARFEGDGLEPPNGNDDVGHKVFQMESERRITQPVPVINDEDEVPTLEIVPEESKATAAPTAAPPAASARSRHKEPTPTKPIAPLQSRRAAAPAPRGPSVNTLRVVFLGIGALVAGVFLTYWLTRN
ncbi:MAG TPA: Stp1/IreP family PP2C-type Ser/Thr phosphatase [Gemmatimonadaceae bacterium]|nr:Stp1/IreP family PP2C-type Ser/Thr phosphatase [Gemmatimonadaceae bacterium]